MMNASASPGQPSSGRFPSWLRSTTSMARGRLAILTMLVLLTVGAWAMTVYQARTMDMSMGIVVRGQASGDAVDGMSGVAAMAMSGMAASGWSLLGMWAFLWAWAVMMAGMMFPAAMPVLLLFDRVHAQRRATGSGVVPTWIFAAGYLLVWTAVGIFVYALVQLGSDLASRLSASDRAAWAPHTLGATLVVAGLYQATPLKRVCLDNCRSPLGFLIEHWRDGWLGALRMGIRHGAYCLGCCWALFAVLVAAGVMSLGWMVLLTLVVFVEKVFSFGPRAATGVGVAFIVLGVLVTVGATGMPWIVAP